MVYMIIQLEVNVINEGVKYGCIKCAVKSLAIKSDFYLLTDKEYSVGVIPVLFLKILEK